MKKVMIFISIILLTSFSALQVSANSAQRYWNGTSMSGTILTDEKCPLEVEKEVLTFEIDEFPENYYKDIESYVAYDEHVIAEYTFYNPEQYNVNATLVFPFGNRPGYGIGFPSDIDTEKYHVTVNNEITEVTLRHTLSLWGEEFELETDLLKLRDDFASDDFYFPDLNVTKYIYEISGIDEETNRAANVSFPVDLNTEETRILVDTSSGGSSNEDGTGEVHCWAENGQVVTVYVFGKPFDTLPEWRFSNGAEETEIDGKIELHAMENMTFQDFVMSGFTEESGILAVDWYNAIYDYIKMCEWECGIICWAEYGMEFDISEHLMRWYEYEITVPAGERITNSVTAPIYPSIDTEYDPAFYEYTYLLSPAKCWKSFGELKVNIITQFYLSGEQAEHFEKTDSGYQFVSEGLPEGEMEFTLCSAEEPERNYTGSYWGIGMLIICVGIILLVGITLIVVIWRKKLVQE